MAASEPQPTTTRNQETTFYGEAGFAIPSPSELAARIPNLEVMEVLGYGGMGVVYKGRQPLLDRFVAIKVLRPDFARDDAFQERFLRESRALARLRHPYIVSVFDVGKSEGLYYLVMEYVEGASLRQLLGDQSITERDTLDFVPQLTDALQHAHEEGVVHRDVKPENVLVDGRGRVRLVDFGLATLLGPHAYSHHPDDDRIAGTLAYMAPEQITMPETVDHRADIYSTGVVFYEMLSGELPGSDRVPPSRKAATDPRLDSIVLRATEREREKRYQQARAMQQEVVAIARTPETSIRLEKHIPAPADEVFAAWSDPREFADWFAPTDEFGPTEGEVDLHVGASYLVVMRPPRSTDVFRISGQYCLVDAPRALSFTWPERPAPDAHETQVTLEFQSRGDFTNLVLTHERFRDEARRNSHAQGWEGVLGRLARKLGG
jgi:serine/threonine protein kinase